MDRHQLAHLYAEHNGKDTKRMNDKQNNDLFGSIPIAHEKEPPTEVETPVQPARGTTAPGPKPSFSRKAIKPKKNGSFFFRLARGLLSAVLIGAGLYLLSGFFLFPYLLKTYGAHKLTTLCGRDITISQARFNPLRLRLELGNTVVGPVLQDSGDTVDPVISFSKLILEINPQSILQGSLILDEISLTQLFVHITKDSAGATNIGQLWSRIRPQPQGAMGPDQSAPFGSALGTRLATHYSINNISIVNSEIIFADQSSHKTHHINELHIDIPTLATIDYQAPRLKPHFSAILNGRPISAGDPQKQDQESTALVFSLQMTEIDSMAYASYLPLEIRASLSGSQARFNLKVVYDPKAPQTDNQLLLSGTLAVEKVNFNSAHPPSTLGSCTFEGWFAPLSRNFFIENLVITHPDFVLTKSKEGHLELLPPFNLIQEPLFPATSPQRIAHLDLRDGTMTFINKATTGKPLKLDNVALSVNQSPDFPEAPETTAQRPDINFSFKGRPGPNSQLDLQGIFNAEKQTAKGFLQATELDFGTLATLSQWFSHPVIGSGTVKQVTANFLSSHKQNSHSFNLDNLVIKAADIACSAHKKPLAFIGNWQSENGYFSSADSTFQFGAVNISNSNFQLPPPKDQNHWQSLLSKDLFRGRGKDHTASLMASALEITNSTIVVNAKAPTNQYRLNRFRLSAPQISRNGQNLFTASAALDKAPVTTSGSFTLSPFSSSGHISAEALPIGFVNQVLAPDQPYFDQGTLRIEGLFNLPLPAFEGSLTLSDFLLSRSNYTLTGKLLNSSAAKLTSTPLSLSFEQLSLDQPRLAYTFTPESPSLFTPYISPQLAEPMEQPPIDFVSLFIRDGNILLTDQKASPQMEISMLNGSLTPQKKGRAFSFTGELEKNSPITLQGTTNTGTKAKEIEGTYQITNFPVEQKNALLGPILGYTINKARLDVTGALQARPETIHHAIDLSVKGLELGPPLKQDLIKAKGLWQHTPLLQALLQDTGGEISLPLVVDNKAITSPYNHGNEIYSEFKKYLLKARVSPFSFLDGGTLAGPVSPTIFFTPGSSSLSPATHELLNNLASTLLDRPLLRLTVSGYADTSSDRQALIDEQMLEIKKRQRQHEQKLSQALSTAYGKEIIDQPFSTDYAAGIAKQEAAKKKIHISEKTLLALAQKRIEETLHFLKTKGLKEKQLAAGDSAIFNQNQLGRDGNRVDFSLSLKPTAHQP